MKAAALIVECVDGRIHAVGGNSLTPLREIAKAVRDSKEIEIGKKSFPVRAGMLIASWRTAPDMQFRC
jgi:hypothetical protein